MHWQEELKSSVTTVEALKNHLSLTDEAAQKIAAVAREYPMAVTPYYLSLIDKDDPNDPILRMCVPAPEEADGLGDADTSGEGRNTRLTGLQHKYERTALVLSTNVCAMYCRHCFRKRMVGLTGDEIARQLSDALAYIAAHNEIDNVLISGGDALMLGNETVAAYLRGLCAIPHIKMIRIGSRMPVVLPERLSGDAELLDIFEEFAKQKPLYLVTQFNHPRELTEQALAAVRAVASRGVVVSNQTVLLRGVNDDPETLAALMTGLVTFGIVPYYVFQCRPARGVCGRFQLPIRAGYRVVEGAKALLNGHAKRFRYVMSHVTGKIELLGPLPNGDFCFKYHQARDERDDGRLFTRALSETDAWLPEKIRL